MSEPLTPAEREYMRKHAAMQKVAFNENTREDGRLLERLLDERDALERAEQAQKDQVEAERERVADLFNQRDTLRAQLEAETEDCDQYALENAALRARCEQLESEQEHTANAVDLISKIEAQRWEKLEARCEQLEQDRERLDWLERNHHHHNGQARFEVGELSVHREHPTIRESIDAAIAALSEPTTEQKREANE